MFSDARMDTRFRDYLWNMSTEPLWDTAMFNSYCLSNLELILNGHSDVTGRICNIKCNDNESQQGKLKFLNVFSATVFCLFVLFWELKIHCYHYLLRSRTKLG